MSTKIKICGITNLIDAKNALNLGADFIGFINIKSSPRYLELEDITKITDQLSEEERFKAVLLSEETSLDKLINHASRVGVKHIQFYSSFSLRDLRSLKSLGFNLFKPIPVRTEEDIADFDYYKGYIDMIILDTKSNDVLGGTGKTFDWSLYTKAQTTTEVRLGLAGGLKPNNISDAKLLEPYLIDISSGVEERAGIKSLDKLKAIFEFKSNE